MCHMTSGICQCAQRTCSLCMYNMLHGHDACKIHILHTHTHPHLFEICFKMPEQNCTRPNLPSLSCMDTYGQPDSRDFVIGILCLPGLNYNRNWRSNRLILCWGRHVLESNISGIFFLRAYIREKSHLKRVAVLFVLVGGFQFDKVVCTWSLSSFFNTLYERYHES